MIRASAIFSGLVISAILLFFFSASTSPLYNLAYSDGKVFQYVGMGIAEGKIPYVDIFDNKGPVLYFINYIAFQIDEEYGVLCLQWLNLSIFFYLCYRIHLLVGTQSCYYSWIFPLLFTFFIRYFDNGNMTEEWSLLPLVLPLFFILPLYQGEKKDLLISQSFFYGVCLGILSLLRLNNTVPLMGLLLWWQIGLIRHKQYSSLFRFLFFAFIGFLLPVLLVALWFYHRAGVYGCYEWIYATVIVNFDFFRYQITQPSSIPLWKILPAVFFHAAFICICLLRIRKSQHPSLIIALVLTIFLAYLSMGQSWYAHYQMILLPVFFISFCMIAQTRQHFSLLILLMTSIFMCKYVVFTEWDNIKKNTNNLDFQQEFARVIDIVPISERGQLWNLNVTIFNLVDVAYQQKLFPLNRVDRPSLSGDKYPQPSFIDQHPIWLIVDENDLDKLSTESIILRRNYQQVARTRSEYRHVLSLYRHKP